MTPLPFNNSLAYAQSLDAANPLAAFRQQFLIPPHAGGPAIYFLGNSLGLQPKQTATQVEQVLHQWAQLGVEGFFMGSRPWLQMHQQLTTTQAEIVGALPQEIVVMNQLTVNLHLMMVSFYRPQGRRTKILCEAKAFPSDQYLLHSQVLHHGLDPSEHIIEVPPWAGSELISEADVLAAIEQHKDELALVLWGAVNYYTGQLFNMERITQAAQQHGILVGFDLAHAAGNVPVQLHQWNVDFACWCNYKYLNSGPGAIGAAYIHERYHQQKSLQRFAGWWGNKKATQFLMAKDFVPEASAEGWQLSTPSPLLYASQHAALQVFDAAGVQAVWQQNAGLNAYLWQVLKAVQDNLPPQSLRIITPDNPAARGCQVSLQVQNGKAVFEALSRAGVFADWREPDVIRIAPVGLYNTFEEVWRFGQILSKAIKSFTA